MAGMIVATLVALAFLGFLAFYLNDVITNGETPEIANLDAERQRFARAVDYYAEKYRFFSDRVEELVPTACAKDGCLCPRCETWREKMYCPLPREASQEKIAWFFGKRKPSWRRIRLSGPIFPLTTLPIKSDWLRRWYAARYLEIHYCPHCGVVFSHRLNAWAWPQEWQTAFLDPAVPLAVQAQPALLADNTLDTPRESPPARDVAKPGVLPRS